ncbi:MAG: alpha/beta fold hydrolase [Anaeromyxobacter sp.]
MKTETLELAARDGYRLAATLHDPGQPPDGAVLIAPAMGVPRRHYQPFAAHLARSGLAALTVDVRGIGGSAPERLRGFPATLHGWGEQDLGGALDHLEARYPGVPLLWVGHSAGGQLLGLVESPRVAAALLVAAQSGHWRLWPDLRSRLLMAGLWWLVIPLLVPVLGRLPLRLLGGGEDVPAGVALEWARWGRDRRYILAHAGPRGGMGFAQHRGPLRSYAVSDDAYAPPATVEALAALFQEARVEVRHVTPQEAGVERIGHFGFFRPRFEPTLWAEAVAWLRHAALTSGAPAGRSGSRTAPR